MERIVEIHKILRPLSGNIPQIVVLSTRTYREHEQLSGAFWPWQ
jgi:hypothetical protein